MGQGLVRLMVERDAGVGQVIERGLEPLVVEGQPVLHADVPPSGADPFVERIVGAGGAERLAVALAEAADRGVVEQHLADRAQRRGLERAGDRALGQRIEAPDALDRLAEEIEAQRLGSTQRDRGRRCRRAPRTRPARAPCRCAGSRCCGKSRGAGRARSARPGAGSVRGRQTPGAAAPAAAAHSPWSGGRAASPPPFPPPASSPFFHPPGLDPGIAGEGQGEGRSRGGSGRRCAG